jgi:hypothetical protein
VACAVGTSVNPLQNRANSKYEPNFARYKFNFLRVKYEKKISLELIGRPASVTMFLTDFFFP